MNKTELIAKIADGAGLTKTDAKKALEAAIENVKDALSKGEKIQVPGIATLSVAVRPERQGKNPATGAVITIPAKKVVKFKAGSELETAIQ